MSPTPWLRRISSGLLFAALVVPVDALADPKDDARRHFVAGLEAAQAKDYEVALQHFLAAQEAYPHPSTLYNIARTYQDLDDLPNALTYYRLFRDADPVKGSDVTPVIAVIEARLHQEATPAVVVPPTTPRVASNTGVPPEVVARLQALAAEMQAKVDEVNALTTAIADGSAVQEPVDVPPSEEGEPVAVVTPPPVLIEPIPALPDTFLTDAYQRVVVTASRYGQEPIDSPSAVTVLTEEDIRLSGATNIADLLRRVVGVESMSLASGQTELSVRGFNRELNTKVLILVDGRSTYLDFSGTTVWATLPISMQEIERIEIIRGPGSAVYGANAVTGVVNIITRVPGEGENVAHIEGGSPLYGSGTVLATGRASGTAYRLSAGYDQTGRWATEEPLGLDSLDYNAPSETLGLRTVRANGRLDRTFGKDGFASLSGGYTSGFAEFYNIGALGDYFLDLDTGYVRGDLALGPLHFRAFWNSASGRTDAWTTPKGGLHAFDSTLDTDVVDLELEGNQEFTTGPVKHHLNAGLSYRYKYTDMPTFIGVIVKEHHASAFIQEEATISKVKVVASLRADRHPLLPLSQTLSPRGAAIVRVADHTSVRVSGGTAFRAPNHLESYMDWSLPTSQDVAYLQDYGDKELRPERILTGEIGVHDESTSFHTADVSLYVNRLTDIIYLKSVTPTTDLEYNEEVGGYLAGTTGWTNLPDEYLGYGIEAEGDLFPVDGVDIYGNMALQRILVGGNGEDAVPDRSASTLKLNGGVTYRTPYRTDLAIHAQYASSQTWRIRDFDENGQLAVSEAPIPARLVLNGQVAVRPFKDEKLSIGAGIWNAGALITGGVREHPKGQPVGSRAFGTLEYKF